MESNFISRLFRNKKVLFIIPNLIYIEKLLHYYNLNVMNIGAVLFYEIVILMFVFFTFNLIIYFFLRKVLKDYQKIFLIMCVISVFYFLKFSLITFLLGVVFVLILIFNFKKFIDFKLDFFVTGISFTLIGLFLYEFGIFSYHVYYINFCSKEYEYKLDVKVDEKLDTPNIYWIHCDGMMGLLAMEKYFKYDNADLKKYFANANYSYNEDASLVAGHKTQLSLTAMFNPYYYDNFFKKYLFELENSFTSKSKRTSFMVDYYEIEEKRLHNELFKALANRNYSTVAIAEFNQYTGFYTDYFYDYYVYDKKYRHVLPEKEFRVMDNRDIDDGERIKLLSYMRFNHFKPLLETTSLYPMLKDVNYLDYDTLNYDDINNSNLKYINDSNYWVSKAIIKGIDESLNILDNKFMFIDFKLNHLPITFNYYGEYIDISNEYNFNYYLGNYGYATKLLTEILEYIRIKDEDAVIFVQGDHGIHMLDEKLIMKYFNISLEEVQDIRNSVISAYYIPDKYKNGDEIYLNNPLNLSRYIVNSYVGKNYEYID